MFSLKTITPTEKSFKKEKEFQGWFGKEIKRKFGYHYKKMSDMSMDKKDCDCYVVDYER